MKLFRLAASGLAAATLVFLHAGSALAAGTAYGVDTAEVGEVGNCKVEAWASQARNHDRLATVSPACVVSAMPGVEISSEITRARADDWLWALSPKLKVNLVPTAIGRFGWAGVAGSTYDVTRGETTGVFAYVPGTLRLSETLRINVSAGWINDRIADRHFASYGLGADWLFAPRFSMTVETFGQFNGQHLGFETRPRLQAGIRFRPVDQFSTDLIYGRNINGEGSSWITLSTTVRFNAF